MRYEIILRIMKYFAFAKCEIKFASKHLRSKYFIRVSVFHSEAISLDVRRISLKKAPTKSMLFSGPLEGIRTPVLQNRNLLRYPAAPQAVLQKLFYHQAFKKSIARSLLMNKSVEIYFTFRLFVFDQLE